MYRKIVNIGDWLGLVSKIIDWGVFVSVLGKMYDDNAPWGGRPRCDVVVVLKVLFLRSWYGLSVEYRIADRISFQRFIGTYNSVTDYAWLLNYLAF